MIFSILEGICALDIFVAGFLGAVGTAFADTLATELGLLYKRPPRLITNFKKVSPGTSGAISPLGEAAMLLAISILSMLAYALGVIVVGFFTLFLLVALSSVAGATIDSLLGATVQAKYRCTICNKIVESKVHCNKETEYVEGVRFFNNHVVNLTSTLLGALIAIILYLLLV